MPKQERLKTNYPGVTYLEGTRADGTTEKIFYIRYRRNGKVIEEKAGRQFQDDMTPARAAGLRARRIEGKEESNIERREKIKAKQTAEDSKWTIGRLWKEYKSQHPEVKAMGRDEVRFNCYLRGPFGEKEPSELVPLDVDRLRIKYSKKLQPATVKNILELLRRIINFGSKKHLTPALSFSIQMPTVNNLKTEDLSQDELGRLLEAIDTDSNRNVANLMKMALFTGMRRGELFKLRWEDVDFERGFINIRGPKGGIDQKIPLNDSAKSVLDHQEKRPNSIYVFPGSKGGQLTDIKKQSNKIKKAAGLPEDFRPLHGLRHVYASMLASSGQVDLYTLQRLLTHKSPQMTQRYAHLRDDALKKASALAGDIITEIQKKSETPAVQLQKRGRK